MMNNVFAHEYFENELRTFWEKTSYHYPKKVSECMEYCLFSGGKRVRPTLALLVAEFTQVDIESALPIAIAIECIHTYSLIHDDLPCMDNDDLRRGKPTAHVKFGEATALLAGDALLNLAYEILFEKVCENSDFAQAFSLIAQNAGLNGMIGGQAIEFENEVFTTDLTIKVAQLKTSALIEAAIMSVALLSYNQEKITALSSYAKAIGLGFQIKDDLLDENKVENNSFVTALGVEKSKNLLERTINIAKKALFRWEKDAEKLLWFADKLAIREY